MKTIQLTAQTQKDLLTSLLKRSPGNYTKYEFTVAEIIDKVKEEGDSALFSYTKKFDKWEMNADNIRVTEAEIEEAFADAEEEFIEVMKRAAANITDFHKKQLRNSWIDTKPDGSILGQRIIPVGISGVYDPGELFVSFHRKKTILFGFQRALPEGSPLQKMWTKEGTLKQ